MPLELKQSMKLAQQLVVTPQLQQAIKLLQLSRLELALLLQRELLENPVLEDDDVQPDEDEAEKKSAAEKHEDAKDKDQGHDHVGDEIGAKDGELKEPANFDWENYLDTYSSTVYTTEREQTSDESPTYENVVSQTESLYDHLLWQLHLSTLGGREQEIGTEIIGNLDDDGYLKASLDEIAAKTNAPIQEVEAVLKRIQEFDPIGVAARDVKECLLLQAAKLDGETNLVRRVLNDCLPDLERHDYAHIAGKMGLSPEKVDEIVHIISALDPKPGRPFNKEIPQYITPDIYVSKVGDDYVVTLNEDGLPKLKVSDFYRRAMMRGSHVGDQTKEYIQERLRSAMWLIRSIHQRQRTLYRVATSIVKFQREFFDKGMSFLKPLVLREVANDINMHESTISRVTASKFMHTPRGIYELKFFFNSGVQRLEGGGVASEVVKMMVKKLIAEEDQHKPLSDEDIAKTLKAQNIDIARRTVAKYREVLNILPSSKRKRME